MVHIEKCDDYDLNKVYTKISSLFEALGGLKKYMQPGMTVAVKPNLVMKKKPEDAATTHPSIVEAVCRLIGEAGCKAVIIDSPGGLYNDKALRGVYSVCGMDKAAENSSALLNHDCSTIEIENEKGKYFKKLTVLKPLVNADLIINLPKLKTHGQMVYTGAVKNMFGAIPGALKAECHLRLSKYEEFADALVDIYLAVKPGLNIMDAVWGMEGYGPTAGKPRKIGAILASENAFELDLAALGIINAPPLMIPVIKAAADRGLCKSSHKEIDISGAKIEDILIENFDVPQLDTLKSIQFFDKGPLKYFINFCRPKPKFIHSKCVGCGECKKLCPPQVITITNKKPSADLKRCIRCFCCQELCPAKAIEIKRNIIIKYILHKK